MTSLKKSKKKKFFKLIIKVREIHKNKLKEQLGNCNFSWFVDKENWNFEIINSDKQLLNVLKEKLNKKIKFEQVNITSFLDRDWVIFNQSLDKVIRTSFFSISQNFTNISKKNKYHLKIPASNSFGTGKHESTYLSIRAIEEISKKKLFSNTLDLGTGSGILAFILKKLHRKITYAVDFDPETEICFTTNRNINFLNNIFFIKARNFLSKHLCGKKFDLIVANILLKPLTKNVKDISNHQKFDGYLVVSGIIKNQVNDLYRYYYSFNYRLEKKLFLNDWACLIMRKKNGNIK